jgi:S-adenosylmethionine hydrolase
MACAPKQSNTSALVFQSDFSLKDGAVSAMKGVAFGVSSELKIYDITHEIPPFNILEGAYRLKQSCSYWPEGTVFVSVVDPGVGSERKSVVMKSGKGHYFVTPDNGTLTFVAELEGIAEVRKIDETKNRLPGSGESYTFHGRDVYAYTGARLAAGVISFEEVGPVLSTDIVRLPDQKPIVENKIVRGNIPVLDVQYGNVWTNIDQQLLAGIGITTGDKINVVIYKNGDEIYQGTLLMSETFAGVGEGMPLAYFNSLLNLSFAVHQGSFAEAYGIQSGMNWTVAVSAETNKMFP